MEKILTIDGRAVGFKATALTPRLYRIRHRRDIIRDLNELRKSYEKAIKAQSLKKPQENAPAHEKAAYEAAEKEAYLSVADLQVFEDLAYTMAKQYDPQIPDSPDEWLDGFRIFDIYKILPEILTLWAENEETTSTLKKK